LKSYQIHFIIQPQDNYTFQIDNSPSEIISLRNEFCKAFEQVKGRFAKVIERGSIEYSEAIIKAKCQIKDQSKKVDICCLLDGTLFDEKVLDEIKLHIDKILNC